MSLNRKANRVEPSTDTVSDYGSGGLCVEYPKLICLAAETLSDSRFRISSTCNRIRNFGELTLSICDSNYD